MGNSVASSVALALGMSLREAWLANAPAKDEGGLSAAESGRLEVPRPAVCCVRTTGGGTPSIPTICKIATPASSPSKRLLLKKVMDNRDVQPIKVAGITTE